MDSNDPRQWMLAEQMVTRMDARMQNKLSAAAKHGLIKALVRVAADGRLDFFGQEPFRPVPPRWTLGGVLARLKLWRKQPNDAVDAVETLNDAHNGVMRSGVIALIVSLLVALLIGLSDFGRPAELGLQIGRDALRRTAASGDIVVIGLDSRSAQLFGNFPWPRRYDAQLIDKLRTMGAKTILIDRALAYRTNADDDAALAAAFDRANGKVWLSVRFIEDPKTGKREPLLPQPIFASRTHQAHGNTWFGMFGTVENFPFFSKIGDRSYPSDAVILAGGVAGQGDLRPDYAIDYRTIHTISAADVVMGRVDRERVAGKTLIIGVTSNIIEDDIPFLDLSRASRVYMVALTAETIKNGVAAEWGYLIPLLLLAVAGLCCIIRQSRRERIAILFGAAVVLAGFTIIGDRLGVHFTIVPALFALVAFSAREMVRGKIISAYMAHPVSGLPNLSHLSRIKGHKNCLPVAVMVERFPQRVEVLADIEQRALVRAIAARINDIAPRHVVHQGDGGVFVFLVPMDDDECDIELVAQQLRALFTFSVFALYAPHDVGVEIGISYDLKVPFHTRVSLAVDRAHRGAYTTLRSVN